MVCTTDVVLKTEFKNLISNTKNHNEHVEKGNKLIVIGLLTISYYHKRIYHELNEVKSSRRAWYLEKFKIKRVRML